MARTISPFCRDGEEEDTQCLKALLDQYPDCDFFSTNRTFSIPNEAQLNLTHDVIRFYLPNGKKTYAIIDKKPASKGEVADFYPIIGYLSETERPPHLQLIETDALMVKVLPLAAEPQALKSYTKAQWSPALKMQPPICANAQQYHIFNKAKGITLKQFFTKELAQLSIEDRYKLSIELIIALHEQVQRYGIVLRTIGPEHILIDNTDGQMRLTFSHFDDSQFAREQNTALDFAKAPNFTDIALCQDSELQIENDNYAIGRLLAIIWGECGPSFHHSRAPLSMSGLEQLQQAIKAQRYDLFHELQVPRRHAQIIQEVIFGLTHPQIAQRFDLKRAYGKLSDLRLAPLAKAAPFRMAQAPSDLPIGLYDFLNRYRFMNHFTFGHFNPPAKTLVMHKLKSPVYGFNSMGDAICQVGMLEDVKAFLAYCHKNLSHEDILSLFQNEAKGALTHSLMSRDIGEYTKALLIFIQYLPQETAIALAKIKDRNGNTLAGRVLQSQDETHHQLWLKWLKSLPKANIIDLLSEKQEDGQSFLTQLVLNDNQERLKNYLSFMLEHFNTDETLRLVTHQVFPGVSFLCLMIKEDNSDNLDRLFDWLKSENCDAAKLRQLLYYEHQREALLSQILCSESNKKPMMLRCFLYLADKVIKQDRIDDPKLTTQALCHKVGLDKANCIRLSQQADCLNLVSYLIYGYFDESALKHLIPLKSRLVDTILAIDDPVKQNEVIDYAVKPDYDKNPHNLLAKVFATKPKGLFSCICGAKENYIEQLKAGRKQTQGAVDLRCL